MFCIKQDKKETPAEDTGNRILLGKPSGQPLLQNLPEQITETLCLPTYLLPFPALGQAADVDQANWHYEPMPNRH